jgi:hypothetical protein
VQLDRLKADTEGAMSPRKPQADVERLMARIGTLVAERQTLREQRSSGRSLERNRREIATLQQQLSQALIARHLPARRRNAA